MSATELPSVEHKEVPKTEKEKIDIPKQEPCHSVIREPEVVPTASVVASEPSPEPTPESIFKPKSLSSQETAPSPIPTSIDPQPDNMVYVPGFDWLESQGEGTAIYDERIYENGNKVGMMG